jgi:hypothetical protein
MSEKWLGKKIIGPIDDPYMTRWFILPRNKFMNLYLHKFHRSDDDRALHDHPWWSLGVILSGGYWEVTKNDEYKWIKRFRPKLRRPEYAHRVELPLNAKPVWTLFMTGPRVRDWGFHCPQGWRHWRDFTKPSTHGGASGEIGRGCDE